MLIITMIVLIILASVTIYLAVGKNGLIKDAQTTSNEYRKKSAREKLELELAAIQVEIANKNLETSVSILDEKKEELETENIIVSGTGDTREVTVDGFEFVVSNSLTIGEEDEEETGTIAKVDKDAAKFLKTMDLTMTLEDIFDSDKVMNRILEDNSKIDYILDNRETYKEYIVGDKNVMKKFASNSYAMNKMLASSGWISDILASDEAIKGLDESNPKKIPVMTSNTAPAGKCFASTEFGNHISSTPWNGLLAYRIADGSLTANSGEDYWTPKSGSTVLNQYVGYSFTEPIWPYKISVAAWSGKQKVYYVLEATNNINDANSWIKLSDELYDPDTTIKNKFNNGTKYQHYRVKINRVTGEVTQSGGGNLSVRYLQVYGK